MEAVPNLCSVLSLLAGGWVGEQTIKKMLKLMAGRMTPLAQTMFASKT